MEFALCKTRVKLGVLFLSISHWTTPTVLPDPLLYLCTRMNARERDIYIKIWKRNNLVHITKCRVNFNRIQYPFQIELFDKLLFFFSMRRGIEKDTRTTFTFYFTDNKKCRIHFGGRRNEFFLINIDLQLRHAQYLNT